jgi:phospholipase/carboxylesterase
MTLFGEPTVAWRGSTDPEAPLVVLLHGRGSSEADIVALADHLPKQLAYVAVRAPIQEGGGYAWFANRGIGRPIAESLTETMAWFGSWLDRAVPSGRPVVLVGFSGGAAFAGGLILDDPQRYTGAAILYGTLPFDAGVATTPARLSAVPILVAHGDTDTVIPRDLLERTWTYLHHEAGSTTTGIRDPGGHGLSAAVVAELSLWLDHVTQPRRSVVTTTRPFEIGAFTFGEITADPLTGRPIDPAVRLREFIDLAVLADQAGLDVCGVGEHHRPDFAIASPAVVLGAVAQATQRIRLTSTVTVLSTAGPVKVFEDFTAVDLISGGRAEITAGRGAYTESFPLFGYDLGDYDDLFDEKFDLLLQLNRAERVSWSGQHRPPLDDVGIYPRPVQPHLPV